MSDNPGSDEQSIADLDVNFDANGFANQMNAAKESVQEVGDAAAESFQKANTVAQGFVDTLNSVASVTGQNNVALQAQNDLINQAYDDYTKLTQATQAQAQAQTEAASQAQATSGPLFARYQNSQADSIANQDPNEMPPIGSLPGENDGSGGGSLFGAAHGIRAASGLAGMAGLGSGGTQAFTGVADLLYLSKGLQSISDLLPKLNAGIEATPSLLTPVIEGFTAIGIPLAGLVALAIPVVAAIVGIMAAINSLVATIKAGADGIAADVTQLEDQAKLSGTGTTSSLAEARDKASATSGVAGDQAALDSLNKDKIGLLTQSAKDFKSGDLLGQVQDQLGLKTLNDAIDAAKKKVDDASVSVNNYNVALQDQQVSINNAAEAARKDADDKIAQQQQYSQYDKESSTQIKATVEQLQGETKARNDAIAILQENQRQLQATNDATGKNNYQIDLNKDKLLQLEQANYTAADSIDHLTTVSAGLADAADKAKLAAADWTQHEQDLADAGKAAAEVDKQRAAATQQLVDDENKYTQAVIDTKQKEANAEQQYDIGFAADTNARLDIATKESRQETQIKEAAAQADADIRTKLQDNLAAADTALQRQFQDDTTKFNDTRAKEVRDEQDTENEDLENHLQKLADIQNQAHNSDQQALLDRNFLQLAKNKEASTQQVAQENERYNTQIDDLREHLANQQRDEKIAFDQQEQQQTLAEERKRDDLELAAQQAWTQQQTNEQRKLATQRTAEQQSLDDLTTTEQRKLQVLRQGMVDELALLQTQEQQRLALIQQTLIDLGPTGAPTGSNSVGRITPRAFAGGGDFSAGDPFTFNEPGSSGFEQVNIGSTSFGSNTAALVIPFGAGNVNPGKGGGQTFYLQPNFYISGNNNAEQVANYAIGKIQDMMEGVINR